MWVGPGVGGTRGGSLSVGSESAPHFNDVPVVLGSSSHGGERKWQGTSHDTPVSG